MKKITILGLTALTLTICLGASLPTFATTAKQQVQATPSYNDINRALAQLKNTRQYFEYASLIQSVESGYTYRLAQDIQTINSSLDLNNKTNAELVNIAKSLPDYNLYVYLYNLVAYTENWLPSYYSASAASRQEAYDAVHDAVIVCHHLLKKPTSTNTTPNTVKTTAKNITETIVETAPNHSVVEHQSVTTASDRAISVDSSASTSSSDSANNSKSLASADQAASSNGTTISVTVLPNDTNNQTDEVPQNKDFQDKASQDTAPTNNIATNLTYAVTATSLAGAALATKREVNNKTRRF